MRETLASGAEAPPGAVGAKTCYYIVFIFIQRKICGITCNLSNNVGFVCSVIWCLLGYQCVMNFWDPARRLESKAAGAPCCKCPAAHVSSSCSALRDRNTLIFTFCLNTTIVSKGLNTICLDSSALDSVLILSTLLIARA